MNDAPANEGGARPVAAEPGPPPGGWARLYALVLAALLADIALLWWLTERYR